MTTLKQRLEFYRNLFEIAESKDKHQVSLLWRELCKRDLYFLMRFVLIGVSYLFTKRTELEDKWFFDRCNEVQANPNGHIDLWSREHGKSSIITFGKTIQDIITDPEITFGIFSHTRPIAKGFLRQIKRELEENEVLKGLFPDVLYANPSKESPKWSLAIDTPVLTINGWKNHGDLQIGDRIFGSKGQIITVIGTSGTMYNVPCRKITFDDCEIVASSEHLWPVQQRNSTLARWTWLKEPEIKILKTDDLPIKDKSQRLPSTPVINFLKKSELLLDPYLLGLWLGDGTAGTNIISMHLDDEEEIISQIKKVGFHPYIHRKKPDDNFSMYGVKGLKEILLSIGCLKSKYIPDEYLYSDQSDRLSLLQGLMDSDGTCKRHGTSSGMCMFSNTNKTLADSVFYLATSLGLRPGFCTFQPKQTRHKRIYHVYFIGIKTIPPFRLTRKLNNCKDKRHKIGRYVRTIEKINSVPVNCIKVDAADHIYLAGKSMVQTHNSEDDGIIVRRVGNPNSATVEAWGLVDSQPTSKHFRVLIYDDVVVMGSVSTPEMITKTTEAWELSLNLGMDGGWIRYVGTPYHYNDTYITIMARGAAIPRLHPGTDDGTEFGKPVMWSKEYLQKKRQSMGPYTFATQILLNPKKASTEGFVDEWLKFWPAQKYSNLNIYLFCDPANEKNKTSDYTVFFLVGIGYDKNYYVITMIRDRINLVERANILFHLHRTYKPKNVFYEKYGMQADIQHYESRMSEENYRFRITPVGGNMPKNDRIKQLIPLFESQRIFLPEMCVRTTYDKKQVDLTKAFINEEYKAFPFPVHDDMLDCLARIIDPNVKMVPPDESVQFITPIIQEMINNGILKNTNTYNPLEYTYSNVL